ncbi:mitochondrial carrier domain-containing protein [Phascolomyces articulosus]|uniref:Mitochondrial carrier domain-containing protein n=1 Tax=Phascolomyces articulosus TaxID=60185 RepID=A0AAD5JQG6_9FUNG|nr:mitochondrial carrier domain-containing protein [Phascolomyces articulosus]
MSMRDYHSNGGSQPVSYNPLRPYYTPGLHHQHNYTSLPSSDTIPGHTPQVFVDDEGIPLKSTTTKFTSFAAFKYFMTMCTSPFEVGTTLLQVQYAPHESVEVIGFRELSTLEEEPVNNNNTRPFDELSSSDEEGGFFGTRPQQQQQQTDTSSQWSSPSKRQRSSRSMSPTETRSVYDDSSRPKYQMAPMNGGVLDILGRIMKQPTEGWKSLFKGQRVTWIYEMLWGFLQPGFESTLNDVFGLYDDTIPLMHLEKIGPNLITIVVSHIVVGVLLSPLEIIRTRLIVQSASPTNSKYKGIIHAFRTMCREEGGVRAIYLSQNLVPTILYHTVRPLLASSIPIVIDRTLGISAQDSPILYGAAELTLRTLGLIITLPLETIRKRLHCQVPSKGEQNYETTVAIRPIPYKGVLDALYKIMKEEGTKEKRIKQVQKRSTSSLSDTSSDSEDDFLPPKPKRNTTTSSNSAWGIRGLYKGFGMQLAANGMAFVFHAINGMDEDFDA